MNLLKDNLTAEMSNITYFNGKQQDVRIKNDNSSIINTSSKAKGDTSVLTAGSKVFQFSKPKQLNKNICNKATAHNLVHTNRVKTNLVSTVISNDIQSYNVIPRIDDHWHQLSICLERTSNCLNTAGLNITKLPIDTATVAMDIKYAFFSLVKACEFIEELGYLDTFQKLCMVNGHLMAAVKYLMKHAFFSFTFSSCLKSFSDDYTEILPNLKSNLPGVVADLNVLKTASKELVLVASKVVFSGANKFAYDLSLNSLVNKTTNKMELVRVFIAVGRGINKLKESLCGLVYKSIDSERWAKSIADLLMESMVSIGTGFETMAEFVMQSADNFLSVAFNGYGGDERQWRLDYYNAAIDDLILAMSFLKYDDNRDFAFAADKLSNIAIGAKLQVTIIQDGVTKRAMDKLTQAEAHNKLDKLGTKVSSQDIEADLCANISKTNIPDSFSAVQELATTGAFCTAVDLKSKVPQLLIDIEDFQFLLGDADIIHNKLSNALCRCKGQLNMLSNRLGSEGSLDLNIFKLATGQLISTVHELNSNEFTQLADTLKSFVDDLNIFLRRSGFAPKPGQAAEEHICNGNLNSSTESDEAVNSTERSTSSGSESDYRNETFEALVRSAVVAMNLTARNFATASMKTDNLIRLIDTLKAAAEVLRDTIGDCDMLTALNTAIYQLITLLGTGREQNGCNSKFVGQLALTLDSLSEFAAILSSSMCHMETTANDLNVIVLKLQSKRGKDFVEKISNELDFMLSFAVEHRCRMQAVKDVENNEISCYSSFKSMLLALRLAVKRLDSATNVPKIIITNFISALENLLLCVEVWRIVFAKGSRLLNSVHVSAAMDFLGSCANLSLCSGGALLGTASHFQDALRHLRSVQKIIKVTLVKP